MARPKEYTRLRRLAMQAVLCGALGLTVALAWWVERTHAGALAFKLGPAQRFTNRVASLDVRVPVGWRASIEEDNPGEAILVAKEGKPRYGFSRDLLLRVHRIAGRVVPTPEDAAMTFMEPQMAVRPPERLDFLGVTGTLNEYAALVGEPGADDGKPPTLLACAVMADTRILVSVELFGVHRFAAADFDLIRSFAKGLSAADLTHPTPPVLDPLEVELRASPHRPGDRKKEEPPKEPGSDNPDSP